MLFPMHAKPAIAPEVRHFIEENFLFRVDREQLSDTESLLEAGLIDSTGVLELVDFLETKFQIKMADSDIVPEKLDSVKAIVEYVEGQLRNGAALSVADMT
jgi:acyl carrier protein